VSTRRTWAIKVIWENGEEEYVRVGSTAGGRVASFFTRDAAQKQADFLGMGIDEAQSINVVPYPEGQQP